MPWTTLPGASPETAPTDELSDLARRLGHDFTDPGLLAHALTHRSWCAENDGYESNERLEFLGDAVLGMIVTDHIFTTFPTLPEGALAKVRASVVSSVALAEVGAELALGPHLLLGKGEIRTGGRDKSSILADAVEAVIGAVYLDGGADSARRLVMRALHDRIELAAEGPGGGDFKTRLQEHAARDFDQLPHYVLTEDGPDHDKRFFATVMLDGRDIGTGVGRSKKQAQQAAAESAWVALSGNDDVSEDELTRSATGEPVDIPAAAGRSDRNPDG